MKAGITLPQFRDRADAAIETARAAEAAGLDGVFVFDHLWPLGQPHRPILHSHSLLGALVQETERVTLGILVARVGVMADAVRTHALVSLHRMAQGRFVAGLGTGDSGNRSENDAYGVPFAPVAERVAELITLSRELRAAGVRTWVGGRSRAVRRAAAHEADGWNCWGWCADVETFSAAAAEVRAMAPEAEISWAAQVLMGRTSEELDSKRTRFGERADAVYATVDELASRFQALSDAGAAWVICAPLDVGTDPSAIEMLAEAGQQAR